MRLIVFNSSLSLFSWLLTWIVVLYYKPVVFYAIIFILPLKQHSDDKPVPIRGSPATTFSVVSEPWTSHSCLTGSELDEITRAWHFNNTAWLNITVTSKAWCWFILELPICARVLEIRASAHCHQAGGKYNISVDSINLTLC